MAGIKEKDVQRACLDVLRAKKIFHWRNNSGAYKTEHGSFIRFGIKGSPDIIAIHPKTGQFIGIEVKTKKGKLNENQKLFKKKVEENNAIYIVVRSTEDIVNFIEYETTMPSL